MQQLEALVRTCRACGSSCFASFLDELAEAVSGREGSSFPLNEMSTVFAVCSAEYVPKRLSIITCCPLLRRLSRSLSVTS